MSVWARTPSVGPGLDLAAQHVPGRDVRHDVVVRQANALRSLAGPLLAEDYEPDPGDHRSPT